jgi:hypothetical protein
MLYPLSYGAKCFILRTLRAISPVFFKAPMTTH